MLVGHLNFVDINRFYSFGKYDQYFIDESKEYLKFKLHFLKEHSC